MSGPVPDVAPQDPVQLVKCFLGTGVPVKISPSGDDRVQVAYQYCCLRTPVFNNDSLQLVNHRPDTYLCRPDQEFSFGIHPDVLAKKVESVADVRDFGFLRR
jgi:hypothetical protein